MLGVGVALLAVFAFSAMAVASSAMAGEDFCFKVAAGKTGLWTNSTCTTQATGEFELVEFLLAEWLENLIAISETMLVETTGTLLLANTNAAVIKTEAAVECGGTLDGDIGPSGADDITEVLGISLIALSGTSLSCKDERDCESSKVWAMNLPWLTLLELWEEESPELTTGFVILLKPHPGGGNVGWYVECTLLGTKAHEECLTPEGAAEAKNVTGGVEGTFSIPFTELMGLKLALCSGDEEETGVVEGSGVEVTSLAGPLTVSSS